MKIYILLLFLFIFANAPANAQQANNWYFGNKAGLNFNTVPPTALLDGEMITNEGCAVMSDNLGHLMFYTDGRKIWNKNHQVMPNGSGLMGHLSSTHSALVIPKPGNNNIFYLFTSDAYDNLGVAGYRYSEIDMTLNGGLGDISTVKNVLLYGPCSEKMTAASHANGIDTWLITKDPNNHNFRSFKITCNGLDLTPVISSVDPINNILTGYRTGCMKISPDGTRLANARNLEGKWDLFKFDNSTGLISDRKMIIATNQLLSYGIEFSPNSQLVYVNADYTYQFKIDVYDSTAISNSKYKVDNDFISHGALQLGPDRKIYSNTYLSTSYINHPDIYGVNCDYREKVIPLGGRLGNAGFPTFFGQLVTNYNLDYTYTFQPDCKTVVFTGNSNIPGPLTWTWDFGDGNTATGQNVTHAFPSTPNQFTVKLTVDNSGVCGGTSSRSKIISFNRVAPTALYNYTTSCNNLQVSFNDQSTIGSGAQVVSWNWDFGDGNTSNSQHPANTYAAYGNYTVRLIVTSNDQCNTKDTLIQTIIVAAKPTAAFSAMDGCYTQAFQFTDLSTVTNSSISNWYWNFGDGNSSTSQNPVHIYAAPGTYIVKLAVKSIANCNSDTFNLQVVAGAKPIPGFTLPSICLLDAVAVFNNTSIMPGPGVLSYNWYFDDPNATPGNPNSSTLVNPSHTYSNAALYNVKLVATSSLGCKDSVTKPFLVNGAVPKAYFKTSNTQPFCSNRDISITDSSYVDFGNITKLMIDWGDGNTTTDNAPGQQPNGKDYTHRYTNFGTPASKTFTVLMTAYSGASCIHSFSRQITVHASPEILFNPIPGICNEALPFNITQASEVWGLTGTGTYSGAGITNGAAGTINPALLTPGSYPVTYTYITNFGCRADSVQPATINPTPVAAFNFVHGCLPNAAVQFTSTATVPGGHTAGLQHLWNFADPLAGPGNPNTSTNTNPIHTYHNSATYGVTLQTTSDKGCVHDTVINLLPGVAIFPQPKADFKIDSLRPICAGSPVYFINQSNGGGQAVAQYQWQFGPGIFSSAQNASYAFPVHGSYPVALWLTNAKGCISDTVVHTVIVHSIPKASFSFDSTCLGKPVQFMDKSSNTLGSISVWNWNLGNNSSSSLQNPVTIYNAYLPYTVTLKVSTPNGCTSAAASKTFSVRRVNINAGNDTAVANGQPLQLLVTGAATYNWSPSTGLSNNSIPSPVAVLYNNDQTYYIKGTTAEGCVGFDTLRIKLYNRADIYIPNAFTPNGDGLNDFLRPLCIGVKLSYFRIFDRWGALVFAARNEYDRWDGTQKGLPLPIGSFTWIAEGVAFDGRLIQKKGMVTVVR